MFTGACGIVILLSDTVSRSPVPNTFIRSDFGAKKNDFLANKSHVVSITRWEGRPFRLVFSEKVFFFIIIFLSPSTDGGPYGYTVSARLTADKRLPFFWSAKMRGFYILFTPSGLSKLYKIRELTTRHAAVSDRTGSPVKHLRTLIHRRHILRD